MIKKNNKKGEVINTLIAIIVLATVLTLLSAYAVQKTKIQGRPIGTSQTTILEAIQETQKAQLYVEDAAKLANKLTLTKFNENGGLIKDFEGERFPCGKISEIAYWNNKNGECIPNFEENLLYYYQESLISYLQHPNYYLPTDYIYKMERKTNYKDLYNKEKETVKIKGISKEPLHITFQGGGTQGFELDTFEKFSPDYQLATVPASLNRGTRAGQTVEHIILHYTVTKTIQQAIDALGSKNSYHYLIDKDGKVYQLVPEYAAAQHAGCSQEIIQEGSCLLTGMNQKSIGISFINCGYDESCQKRTPLSCDAVEKGKPNGKCWEEYTKQQIDSMVSLIADILTRNPSLLENNKLKEDSILMHADVSKHKVDPGPIIERQLDELKTRIMAEYNDYGLQKNTELKSKVELNDEVASQKIEEDGFSEKETNTAMMTSNSNRKKELIMLDLDVEEKIDSYDSIIKKYSELRELDEAIIKAIIYHESMGKANADSGVNALGLMQIVPFSKKTKKMVNHEICVNECGFTPANNYEEVNKEEYFDPEKNICCGTYILKQMSNKKPLDWNCCGVQIDKGICVKATYDSPYAIAARYYNGGTCANYVDPDYVESISEIYVLYGGNTLGTYLSEENVFVGEYKSPLYFETELELDLNSKEEISKTAKKIIDECHDLLEKCTDEKIVEHNEKKREEKNAINEINNLVVNKLIKGEDCMENIFLTEFIINYKTCFGSEGDKEGLCEISIPINNNLKQEAFLKSLYFDSKGIYYNQPTNDKSDNQEVIHEKIISFEKEMKLKIKKESEKEENVTSISLTKFKTAKSGLNVQLNYDTNNLFYQYVFLRTKPGNFTFYIKKEGEELIFLSKENKEIEKEEKITNPKKEFVFCEKKENNPIKFALTIEDETPPKVEFISGRFSTIEQNYQIQFKPLTTYEDKEDKALIPDIASYEVHCKKTPFKLGEELTKETLSQKITYKNGLFPAEKYKEIPAITANVESCGDLGPVKQVISKITNKTIPEKYYFVIIAKDRFKQYSKNYELIELSNNDYSPLPFSRNYPEQNNEEYLTGSNQVEETTINGQKELITMITKEECANYQTQTEQTDEYITKIGDELLTAINNNLPINILIQEEQGFMNQEGITPNQRIRTIITKEEDGTKTMQLMLLQHCGMNKYNMLNYEQYKINSYNDLCEEVDSTFSASQEIKLSPFTNEINCLTS